jgi:hypothetical protein
VKFVIEDESGYSFSHLVKEHSLSFNDLPGATDVCKERTLRLLEKINRQLSAPGWIV